MKVSKEVVMNLAVKDGSISLVIDPTVVHTKAEAIMLAAAIRKMANNLPDHLPRAKPGRAKSSRPTASRPSRRRASGDTAAAATSAE